MDQPKTTSSAYLPVLDVVRIVAILGVIFIHTVGGGVQDGTLHPALVVLRMAAVPAVPLFFMISGALTLSPRAHRYGVRAFLHSRLSRVLPALVVWSAFYMLIFRHILLDESLSWGSVLTMIIRGDTFIHLYFLWAILGLYLMSPVLWAFLASTPCDPDRERRRALPLAAALMLWSLAVFSLPHLTRGPETPADLQAQQPVVLGALTYPLAYAGYYTMGRALALRPLHSQRLDWVLITSFVPFALLLTLLYHLTTDSDQVSPLLMALQPSYLTAPVILASLALYAGIMAVGAEWRINASSERLLRRFGNATFGVFLVHFAILLGLRMLTGYEGYGTIAVIGLWAATAILSFLVSVAAQKVRGLRRIF